ncbi:glycosyltransferase [Puteibacter caeruleilacunae]|nr:glycosyltransferase [Puteibacter caeruleilacunae]
METQPFISVILPFYNAEKTLDRALASIANQSYKYFECIMIDNNSSDNSNSIACEWQRKDSRFILTQESKQGVVHASNKGSEKASGKYIARMDADDWSFPDRLKLQCEFLEQHPEYGAVSGLVEYKSHTDNTDGFKRYVDWLNSVISYNDILKSRFIESPIVNPSAMWRQQVAASLGMYHTGDFPEDYELWLRWLDAGVKIGKIEAPIIKWFDSFARLTRTDSIYSDNAFYRIKTKYLDKWLKENHPGYPSVLIWGASRTSRNRAAELNQYGIKIEGYIDIKKGRQLDKEVIFYQDIPKAGKSFILVYFKHSTRRKQISDFLLQKDYVEGKDFLFVS